MNVIPFTPRQPGVATGAGSCSTVSSGPAAIAANQAPTATSGLPDGFVLKGDGVYKTVKAATAENDGETMFVCSPLAIAARFRDSTGKGWGRIISLSDYDGVEHRIALDDKTIEGKTKFVMSELVSLGLRVGHATKVPLVLKELLLDAEPPSMLTSTNRLGWTTPDRRAFVLGAGRIIGDQTFIYRGQAPANLAEHVVAKGSLEDWKAAVGVMCVGNPLMILAVSLALSGPLLEVLGRDGGGLHFFGKSSRGKSTLLRTATSVWGGPEFTLSWRATTNGLEAEAAAANGMVLALDEIGSANGHDLGSAIYMLANGVGKARSDALGQSVNKMRWRVSLLSTGELRVVDHMVASGRQFMAGHGVRLIDVASENRRHGAFDDLHEAADASELTMRLQEALSAFYGTLGPAFVEKLIDEGEKVNLAWSQSLSDFKREADARYAPEAEGQIQRVIDRLALIAAAGELASGYGLTGWPNGAATEAALELLGRWLADRAVEGGSQTAWPAAMRIAEYLSTNGDKVVDLQPGTDLVEANEYAQVWADGRQIYMTAALWKEIHLGHDPQQEAKTLLDAGILISGEGKNLARKPPRAIAQAGRLYTLQISELEKAVVKAHTEAAEVDLT
jgi:putative DNA primase/helicase